VEFTGERFIGDLSLGLEMEVEHYHRYLSVQPLVEGKVVLDAACGSGFGSFILSQKAKKVIGIDISKETIDFASAKYDKDNIGFRQASIDQIPLPDHSVDMIVSFETIEHVNSELQSKFLAEAKRVLTKNGTLIISTPNKHVYSDLREYSNEYHVKEFYRSEFETFLQDAFKHVKIYNQGFQINSIITDTGSDIRVLDGRNSSAPRYFIAVCTNDQVIEFNALSSAMLNLQDYYVKNNQDVYHFINKQLVPRKQTLYLDYGRGFNEWDVVSPDEFDIEGNKFRALFKLPKGKQEALQQVRWDPDEGRFTSLLIKSVYYKTAAGDKGIYSLDEATTNGFKRNSVYHFFNMDPFVLFDLLPGNLAFLEIVGEYVPVEDQVIQGYLSIMYDHIAQLQGNALQAEQQIRAKEEEYRDSLSNLKVELHKQQTDLENRIGHLQEENTRHNTKIEVLMSEKHHLNNEYKQLLNQKAALEQKHAQSISEVNAALLESNAALLQKQEELDKQMNRHDEEVAELQARLAEAKGTIQLVMVSNSWRITKPLRAVGRLCRTMPKKFLKKTLRLSYRIIPMPNRSKVRLKNLVYRSLKPLISNTGMYKIWEASNGISSVSSTSVRSDEQISIHGGSSQAEFIKQIYSIPAKNADQYVTLSNELYHFSPDDVKLIALYLPQFHPFPENDEWWGKGFTEWTNVSKAMPQFVGHYQPHLPGELGFYDLRLTEVMERQIELAKRYGIYGFCFYHYWFDGKRLMERPVDMYIANENLDMPFCICWANENWTRRWDGEEHDILIEQNYSSENDLALIQDLKKYITDKRYIKVDGKPIVIVYRPALLPDFQKTADIWRNYCREQQIGEIHLVGVSWGIDNPASYGLDALMEFPPHCIHEYGSELINDQVEIMNPNFHGLIFDYEKFVEEKKYLFDPGYVLYKGVSPSWDNTARKPNNGTVYYKSSPELYKKWLKNVLHHTQKMLPQENQFVFINAWNEWAEGAHLEPDRKYGYAHLEATRNALIETKHERNKKIIYVSHDANFNGAQLLSLNIIKSLKLVFHYSVEIVCLSGGPLLEEYKQYGHVTVLNESRKSLNELACRLKEEGYEISICNTVISGELVKVLSENGVKVISLIHELPGVIKQYSAVDKAKAIAQYADKVIFPSEYVLKKFQSVVDTELGNAVVRPQGLYKLNPYKSNVEDTRQEVRKQLQLPANSKIVLGVGYADHRKGIDLFAETAALMKTSDEQIAFVWVGSRDIHFLDNVKQQNLDHVLFVDPTEDIGKYYAAADLYLLTSREDPFPSVVLESFDVGVPVIGFRDAGGFTDIVTEETGRLVEHSNVGELAGSITELLSDDLLRASLGNKARKLVEHNYYFADYMYDLLAMLGHEFKKVSVIVPNYNYASYVHLRLDSIAAQHYPIYELIVLDDCSTDRSVKAINEYLENTDVRSKMNVVFVQNEMNSGSVFKQWAKGISLARGEYIWIAEADDLCSSQFLEEVMKGFHLDSEVVLSYAQSRQMNGRGDIIAPDYLAYTNEIDSNHWNNDYLDDGMTEIKRRLSVKNTIPNVSAVVFKKFSIDEILDELQSYRVAGDWYFYIWLLSNGKIYYNHAPLNDHRRHEQSVTKSERSQLHYDEVVRLQEYIDHTYGTSTDIQEKVIEYRKFLAEYLKLN
jgi:O-antigen biosynthesis protein